MVEITLEAGNVFEQDLPSMYNGFLSVLNASLRVGDVLPEAGQVGWLDGVEVNGVSTLTLAAGNTGGRVVPYAGQPPHYPIVTHGPFVGGNRAGL